MLARGCDITGTDRSGFDEAMQAAKRAEIAIVVVGERHGAKGGPRLVSSKVPEKVLQSL